MAQKWMMICTIALLMGLVSGCGYKAPPYYEKPSPKENSSVAL
jgi:predicted small lipoprotein YifL